MPNHVHLAVPGLAGFWHDDIDHSFSSVDTGVAEIYFLPDS